ncbi:hypothetical protein ACJZ2D_010293 [Fusarium nematophilum]
MNPTPAQEGADRRDINSALARLSLANRPAAKFDNFYTPENPTFYSRQPYLPLSTDRSEIRLLKVHLRKASVDKLYQAHPHWGKDTPRLTHRRNPHQGPVSLGCDLLQNVPLSRVSGQYSAVSYCAGSPKETAKILVNGVPFNAFANLEHALECVISCHVSKNPDQELLIWVDQICVNQRDHQERALQVGMMRDIYRRSKETYICLSSAGTPATSRAMSEVANPKAQRSPSFVPQAAAPRFQNPLEPVFWEVLQDKACLERWIEASKSVFACPWWSRAWVFQEFIVSPLAGSAATEQRELATQKFRDEQQERLRRVSRERREWDERRSRIKMEYQQKLEADSTWQTNKAQVERDIKSKERKANYYRQKSAELSKDKPGTIARLLLGKDTGQRIYKSRYRHCQRQISLAKTAARQHENTLWRMTDGPPPDDIGDYVPPPEIAEPDFAVQWDIEKGLSLLVESLPKIRSKAVASMMSGRANRRNLGDMKRLLEHTRLCQSSDPRDRIYAFLGLADPGYDIKPDYSPENTIVHMLIHIARRIIEHEDSLALLNTVHPGSRGALGVLLPTPFSASGKAKPEARFRGDHRDDSILDLGVSGFRVDILDDSHQEGDEAALVLTFTLGCDNLIVTTTRTAQFDDEVWVLRGAEKPFVLRHERDDCYSLIGEAAICDDQGQFSDIMFGALFDKDLGRFWKLQDIYIV